MQMQSCRSQMGSRIRESCQTMTEVESISFAHLMPPACEGMD